MSAAVNTTRSWSRPARNASPPEGDEIPISGAAASTVTDAARADSRFHTLSSDWKDISCGPAPNPLSRVSDESETPLAPSTV